MMNYNDFVNNAKFYLDKKIHKISNLANLSAYIFNNLENINWAGFYLIENGDLYLGPFQGKPACSNIQMGKGVCGTSAAKREVLVVDDVNKFSGHIACDSVSKSEIVIPIITKNGDLLGVLDIDSPINSRFDKDLAKALENIVLQLVDIL
ncbi:MAG: GAF domain-containing protein [Tenericutes bacterium]|nr:GAF domain-containing protein [Mycoplasmatota bacterium]